ncbi:MAG: D-alanyl-D-alanine carboxypeptidase [Candidatus Peregrinibacteria bacterium Greene0416_62]|nr:MAG: D-alanyl-D-alanine carboxypeptidase [Candidatus Peregrinibacteria bacterium Greene0416_62]TSC99929.1 MAG: D-alanyl-D-alanine carboxypeptidase [Candidatus Peregrinibacteria bacterium Greene1014_49]
MLRTLLSVLLLGMVPPPFSGSPLASVVPLLEVAPPAIQMELASRLSASGVIVLDAQSGQRVFGRQYDIPRPMASLTKLMTALIIVENHQLSEIVRVPIGIDPMQSSVRLPGGEQFTVGDLLSAMMIASANDAAATLALFHSGSVDTFVEEMNARAATLGLHATTFENPVGLDDPLQRSTPQDLAWLTMAALRQPAIARRLGMRGAIIVSLQGSTVNLFHTHALMHTVQKKEDDLAPVVLAGKTGTTNGAGQCLMSVVGENDRRYIVVLLDSLQRYRDMNLILAALTHETIPSESLSLRTLNEENLRP